MFNKKEKIEFYSTNVYSLISHPIERIDLKEFSWFNKLKAQMKNIPVRQNTLKCPGIFEPFRQGFVLRSWYDFTVLPTKDELIVEYPSRDIFVHTSESIDFHDPMMLTNYFLNGTIEGKKCHKKILKINTSWFIKLPSGYQLMQTNLPLSEEHRFSAVTGIYDPLINNQITVPLFWHIESDDPVLIKAGTPLCLLMPIKTATHEVIVREASDIEYKWAIFNHKRNNTFIRNYDKMKEIAKKFFSKNY
jgi:hypothetical protein